MICYKVCRNCGNGRYASSHAPGRLQTAYRVGKFVSAPVGALFAFRRLQDAEGWRDVGDVIFRAEGQDTVRLTKRVLRITELNRQTSQWYWDRVAGYGPEALVSLPSGSVAVKRLKLLEQLVP